MYLILTHPENTPYTLALLITFNNQTKNQFKSEYRMMRQTSDNTHKGMIGRYTIEGTYSGDTWIIAWCH